MRNNLALWQTPGRPILHLWHAAGSIQSSEATCESIASQLKKGASTGGVLWRRPFCREADVSLFDESIILCRNQEDFVFSLRAAQRSADK